MVGSIAEVAMNAPYELPLAGSRDSTPRLPSVSIQEPVVCS